MNRSVVVANLEVQPGHFSRSDGLLWKTQPIYRSSSALRFDRCVLEVDSLIPELRAWTDLVWKHFESCWVVQMFVRIYVYFQRHLLARMEGDYVKKTEDPQVHALPVAIWCSYLQSRSPIAPPVL
jgi:hypothetical protein